MRIAGCSYLVVIACGAFAEIVVRQSVVVADDAAATADALAAHETLWRWGLAIHIVYLIPAALTNLLLSQLFSVIEPTAARFMLVLGMLSVAVEAAALAFLTVPLLLTDEASALGALAGEQGQALAYLAIHLYSAGWSFALVFFSGFCVLLGLLISRSQLVPRFLGTLMVIAGACYFISSLLGMLNPPLSNGLVPWVLLPCLVGELTLAVWLSVGPGHHSTHRRAPI
jgi:hypothetical protein